MILKKGYTTGVYVSFAFKSALNIFCTTQQLSICKTIKGKNDDLDVTQGCEIVVCISNNIDELSIHQIKHKPYILYSHLNSIEIYAANGIGIVTKNGLKPPIGYPAINPTPLKALEYIFKTTSSIKTKLYCTVGVTNGTKIAKQTANEKVGIKGGISILGTTGWVKPISSTAYLQSIKTELDFAKANLYDTIIFTLGNSAYKEASLTKKSNEYIIEIGNFIYDGIDLAIQKQFHIVLYLGIAKAVKVAQGFKNTHNRFGSIDFDIVQNWVDIDISQCITIKRVRQLIKDKDDFDNLVKYKALEQLTQWFHCNIDIKLSKL